MSVTGDMNPSEADVNEVDDTQADEGEVDDTRTDGSEADDTRTDEGEADDTRSCDTQTDDPQSDDDKSDDEPAADEAKPGTVDIEEQEDPAAASPPSETEPNEAESEQAASQPGPNAEPTTEASEKTAVGVPAVTGALPIPAVTGSLPISSGLSRHKTLISRGLLAVALLVVGSFTVAQALTIRGHVVEGTTLTPAAYLDQVVVVEIDEVAHTHTLAELGWTTEPTDAATGLLFARRRVHASIEPTGGAAGSPLVADYRSALEREPVAPSIDAQWTVVEGQPGTGTNVAVDGVSPPVRIRISTSPIAPESSVSLRQFVRERNLYADGWEITLPLDDETDGASLEATEVAAHIRFNRETARLDLVEVDEFRDLLAERIRRFATGGERGRFEFEPSRDGTTPLIRSGRFTVTDTLTEPIPGQVPDIDRAWRDLVSAVRSYRPVATIHRVDADDLYGGVDPADLTVKLAESRTPNTGGSRMTNIRNVLEVTRGIVVEPGGVFGINQTVGRRTVESGFVTAGAIANGEHVEAFGGGISQTATMFHQAGYMAGLTFPEREGGGIGGGHGAFGHSEYFGRYNNYHAEGWGLDGRMDTDRLGRAVEQTVNWPNREAGFINTTPYPILVWTFDIGDEVGVSLWSLERTRFGVYEGTDTSGRGSCIDWTHYRTVYDMDNNVMFEDSYRGFYRTSGPTCAVVQPKKPDGE